MADFFKTQISHTSFDDFQGRPVLVFRTTPEASWQSVLKQLIDFVVRLFRRSSSSRLVSSCLP